MPCFLQYSEYFFLNSFFVICLSTSSSTWSKQKAITELERLIQVSFISLVPFVILNLWFLISLSNPDRASFNNPDNSFGVIILSIIFSSLILIFTLSFSSNLSYSSLVTNVYGNSSNIHLSQNPLEVSKTLGKSLQANINLA
jgi:hypothetical protein